MSTLFDVWNTIQTELFPSFEQELDPLTKKEQEFIQIVTLLDLPSHMKAREKVDDEGTWLDNL